MCAGIGSSVCDPSAGGASSGFTVASVDAEGCASGTGVSTVCTGADGDAAALAASSEMATFGMNAVSMQSVTNRLR